jgi:hypothetical protein
MLKMEDWCRKVVSKIPGIGVGRSLGFHFVRTFFNTVLLVSLELVGMFLLVGYTLGALLVVVSPDRALCGASTICRKSTVVSA